MERLLTTNISKTEWRKQAARENAASSRHHEWTDDTLRLLGLDAYRVSLLRSEQEKLSGVTERIRAIIKERDDALRKNEPLVKQILHKDQIIDGNTREIARALESRSAREDSLSLNIIK